MPDSLPELEPIDLLHHPGHRRRRAWACGAPASWQYREVAVGQLPDRRWYASRSGGQGWSFAGLAADERQALKALRSWMARVGGEWRPTPAIFSDTGAPADGLPWWKSGGTWMPGQRPGDSGE